MDLMNKLTLQFKAADIELKYQNSPFKNTQASAFWSPSNVIINEYITDNQGNNQAIIFNTNYQHNFCCPLNIKLFHCKEKGDSNIKIMTLENAFILLLQLNFTASNIHGQEYYLYGSSFSLIQAVTYFATDFYLSCPSVIIHLIFRLVVTTFYAGRFDLVGLGLTIVTAVFLISVLYICNRAQRQQFLMNYKEDTINYQLQTLINKPFTKIIYNEKKLQIDVHQVNQEHQFLGYNQNLCYGCNIRNFIRNCKVGDRILEKWIIHDQNSIRGNCLAVVKRNKIKIRLCQFNTDNSLILILENSKLESKKKQVPQIISNQLVEQFSNCKKIVLICNLNSESCQFQYNKCCQIVEQIIKHLRFSATVNLNLNGNKVVKLKTYAQFLKYTQFKYSTQFRIWIQIVFMKQV